MIKLVVKKSLLLQRVAPAASQQFFRLSDNSPNKSAESRKIGVQACNKSGVNEQVKTELGETKPHGTESDASVSKKNESSESAKPDHLESIKPVLNKLEPTKPLASVTDYNHSVSTNSGRIQEPLVFTQQSKRRKNGGNSDYEKTTPYGWLMLSIPIATFGLGCWQVQRKAWKEGLLRELELQTGKDPVPFPAE